MNALTDKLGMGSHRTQQLGDIMFLYLLSRQNSNSTVKDTVSTTCRDFMLQGQHELCSFIERCKEGQSILPTDSSPEGRRQSITTGLQAIKNPDVSAVITAGIILKLGYTAKPACDVHTMLTDFENLKQRTGEKGHTYINRLQIQVSKMESAFETAEKSSYMPSDGQILTQLKKGCKPEVRLKAYDVLKYIERIPVDKADFQQMAAAIRDAERDMAAEADEEKALKATAAPPPPTKAPTPGDGDKTKNQGQESTQDPALTTALKAHGICVNHVAGAVGKGRPCSKTAEE